MHAAPLVISEHERHLYREAAHGVATKTPKRSNIALPVELQKIKDISLKKAHEKFQKIAVKTEKQKSNIDRAEIFTLKNQMREELPTFKNYKISIITIAFIHSHCFVNNAAIRSIVPIRELRAGFSYYNSTPHSFDGIMSVISSSIIPKTSGKRFIDRLNLIRSLLCGFYRTTRLMRKLPAHGQSTRRNAETVRHVHR